MDKAALEQLINDRIRPYIEMDGGSIELIDVKEGVVTIQLSGACCGCAHSLITLKAGVERTLKQAFPDLKEVVAL